jgi:aminopeptidase N
VSDHTIAATDAFLAQDLNSALRRLVSEGRDGVMRAMRAQQRDREAG